MKTFIDRQLSAGLPSVVFQVDRRSCRRRYLVSLYAAGLPRAVIARVHAAAHSAFLAHAAANAPADVPIFRADVVEGGAYVFMCNLDRTQAECMAFALYDRVRDVIRGDR